MALRTFKVIFTLSAQKDLESLETDNALQLVNDINSYLETSPLPFGKSKIKKLTSLESPLCSLRSGDFRAYYRVATGEVIILAITDKKDSDRILKGYK